MAADQDRTGISKMRAALRIFGSPHRYYQGPDALDFLPGICEEIAPTPALIVDGDVLEMTRRGLKRCSRAEPHACWRSAAK
jgi:glycerol dehydrogenase